VTRLVVNVVLVNVTTQTAKNKKKCRQVANGDDIVKLPEISNFYGSVTADENVAGCEISMNDSLAR